MNRHCDDEEYNGERKAVEFFNENDEEYYDEQGGNEEDDFIQDDDQIFSRIQALKEYTQNVGIPLCQHLNFGILSEFLEG